MKFKYMTNFPKDVNEKRLCVNSTITSRLVIYRPLVNIEEKWYVVSVVNNFLVSYNKKCGRECEQESEDDTDDD